LTRSQVLCRRDDEARDRREATEAEVGRDAPERERGSTLLWRYQGDEQRLVRGAGRADPGTADDRASERLPRPVDERKAGIAERARKIAGDQDRLGAKVIEQDSGGGVTRVAVPRIVASTKPAVAVAKPRIWCR
jgi:hypothetical protein